MMWVWIIVGAVVGLPVLAYALLPLLIKAQMKMQLEGVVREVEDAALPAEDRAFFDALTEALSEPGYVPVGSFAIEGMVPSVRMTFLLLLNPDHHAAVMGSVVRATVPQGDPPPPKRVIEFSSNLEDGREINTGNSVDSVTPDMNPTKSTWVYPDEHNPVQLFLIHDAICAELQNGTPFRTVPMDRSAESFLLDELRLDMAGKAKRGYWTQTADGYALTSKGAYVNTWVQLPPVKGWWQARVRRRCDAMRAKLGV